MSTASGPPQPVPLHSRVHLAHALLQYVADDLGIRLLHVKGPAVHTQLLARDPDGTLVPRHSTDADVLVQPDRAAEFVTAVLAAGARQVNSFRTGSPFEHAATVWFDHLGYADIHRFFPGIGLPPAEAFDLLWADREDAQIAHRPVSVPSERMQRMVLLLHAARSGVQDGADKVRAWDDATDDERLALRALARELRADVAFAAAIGELDRFRGAPEYALWDQFSRSPDHSRTDEWLARIRATRSPWQRLSLIARSISVNTDRLAMDLGRRPTTGEVWRAWFSRVRRGVRELTHGGRR